MLYGVDATPWPKWPSYYHHRQPVAGKMRTRRLENAVHSETNQHPSSITESYTTLRFGHLLQPSGRSEERFPSWSRCRLPSTKPTTLFSRVITYDPREECSHAPLPHPIYPPASRVYQLGSRSTLLPKSTQPLHIAQGQNTPGTHFTPHH